MLSKYEYILSTFGLFRECVLEIPETLCIQMFREFRFAPFPKQRFQRKLLIITYEGCRFFNCFCQNAGNNLAATRLNCRVTPLITFRLYMSYHCKPHCSRLRVKNTLPSRGNSKDFMKGGLSVGVPQQTSSLHKIHVVSQELNRNSYLRLDFRLRLKIFQRISNIPHHL